MIRNFFKNFRNITFEKTRFLFFYSCRQYIIVFKLINSIEGVNLMKRVSLEINGKKVTKEIPEHTTLSTLLRDILNGSVSIETAH